MICGGIKVFDTLNVLFREVIFSRGKLAYSELIFSLAIRHKLGLRRAPSSCFG
jgi:hypothetical protein